METETLEITFGEVEEREDFMFHDRYFIKVRKSEAINSKLGMLTFQDDEKVKVIRVKK